MSDAGPNLRTSTHLFYQQKEEARTGTAGRKYTSSAFQYDYSSGCGSPSGITICAVSGYSPWQTGNKNKTANKKQDRREIFLPVFFLTKKCYPQKCRLNPTCDILYSQNSNTIRITEYQGDFNLFLTKKCYPQKNV
jgi:hypothetical protein